MDHDLKPHRLIYERSPHHQNQPTIAAATIEILETTAARRALPSPRRFPMLLIYRVSQLPYTTNLKLRGNSPDRYGHAQCKGYLSGEGRRDEERRLRGQCNGSKPAPPQSVKSCNTMCRRQVLTCLQQLNVHAVHELHNVRAEYFTLTSCYFPCPPF